MEAKVTEKSVFESVWDRDGMLKLGMEEGPPAQGSPGRSGGKGLKTRESGFTVPIPPEGFFMDMNTTVECPGCGLSLPDRHRGLADRFNASGECLETYYELTYWTLTQQDSRFIHQHAVDAYEAQHAGGKTRPVTAVFGLIGLYLALEKGYTGRQVQLAHMKIASLMKDWPRLEPPARKAELTVMDVLMAESDAEKEKMLMKWAASVWGIWEHRHLWIREMTEKMLSPSINK
jgi:hypothetical protein